MPMITEQRCKKNFFQDHQISYSLLYLSCPWSENSFLLFIWFEQLVQHLTLVLLLLLFQRFALAAVELNGVIYATGGFDGNDYLE